MSGGSGRSAIAAVGIVVLLTLAGCGENADRGAGDDPGAGESAGGGAGGGAAGGGVAAGACLAAVEYDGRLYVQVAAESPDRGEELDGAVVPGCNDTGGEQPAAEPVAAYTITGVDPAIAIAAGDERSMVYVSEDYAPGMVDARPLPQDVVDQLGVPTS